MSLQEEKEKVQAQKEEVLSHMNDVLENELQCIICSEYFIEVIMHSGSRAPVPLPTLGAPRHGRPLPQGNIRKGFCLWELLVADFTVMSTGGHFSSVFVVFFNFPISFLLTFVLEYLLDIYR